MTRRRTLLVSTDPYDSSSGTGCPEFTNLRSTRSRWWGGYGAGTELEDLLQQDAYWFALASTPSTAVSVTPDWGTALASYAERGPEALSPAEQLRCISKTLSLSKVELSKTLGVSRQTIYDWLEGRPLSPENENRVLRLTRLVWDFGAREGQRLLRRFVAEPLREGEPSILGMLMRVPWDDARLRSALREARARSVRRRAGGTAAWLRSLGFPEPSESTKAANVGHNTIPDEFQRL